MSVITFDKFIAEVTQLKPTRSYLNTDTEISFWGVRRVTKDNDTKAFVSLNGLAQEKIDCIGKLLNQCELEKWSIAQETEAQACIQHVITHLNRLYQFSDSEFEDSWNFIKLFFCWIWGKVDIKQFEQGVKDRLSVCAATEKENLIIQQSQQNDSHSSTVSTKDSREGFLKKFGQKKAERPSSPLPPLSQPS